MRRIAILVPGIMLAVAACAGGNGPATSQPAGGGGGGAPTASTNGGNVGGGGNVINPQPPGQAMVSVDGLEYTFEGPILVSCTMEEGFSYSFNTEDGKFALAGGGFRASEGEFGWGGSISYTVTDDEPDPDSGELGFVKYIVFLKDVNESTLAFEGSSMSFSGPMWKQVPGGSVPGEDAGTGTISVTCP